MRVVAITLVCVILGNQNLARAASNAQIDDAIARGKAYLYSQQKGGNWEASPQRDKDEKDWVIAGGQWGGTTAMCVHALLAAGESAQDERIAGAVEFLRKADLVGTYALGMRCQMWLHLPQTPETKAAMKRDADTLLSMVRQQGPSKGFYDYTKSGQAYSLSRAQYGVQGMWAAAQAGVEVPETYWKLVESAWVDAQESGGGWCYRQGGRTEYPVTPGITSVAVATLFITQEFLHAKDGAECKGNIISPPIERGVKWLTDHIDDVAPKEKSTRSYPYATLYGIERVGVAGGRKYFGETSWYAKGSDWLISKQKHDGAWPGDTMIGSVQDSCFALLFLARGRAPVAMNKLEYQIDAKTPGNWNERPRDVANVSRWIGRQIERELNWQIVNFDVPVDELHDSPILYISGNMPLKLSDAHRAKLKEFIEGGGLVLGNADGAARNFSASFQKLGEELFPAYKFRELPANHVIFTDEQFKREKWKTKPSVLALSNGAREFMLLIPQSDPARAWQTQTMDRLELWQLAANVFMYSVDRQNLRFKGDTYVVAADPELHPQRTINMARLRYDGNWDPEPGGWRRLANVLHNQRIDLAIDVVKLGDDLGEHRFAHLTGTDEIHLSESARASLKTFVEKGGTLIVDAAGGSTAFAKSIEAELAGVFPKGELTALPDTHVVYRGAKGKQMAVGYRAFAARTQGATKSGLLRGITIDGRTAVIFSREDMSVGLVGNPIDGILGYDPATATNLMAGILCSTEIKE